MKQLELFPHQPVQPTGITVRPWGFEMTVHADVFPGEMMEPDYPGAPPMADIFHVFVGGVDIAEMLSSAQFARLEDHILRAEDYV